MKTVPINIWRQLGFLERIVQEQMENIEDISQAIASPDGWRCAQHFRQRPFAHGKEEAFIGPVACANQRHERTVPARLTRAARKARTTFGYCRCYLRLLQTS